jgi:hypothetical protein
MKRLVLVITVLTLGFVAATPARADYAIVKFDNGYCRIFWNSAANPVGTGWTKIAVNLPDWSTAWSMLDSAIAARTCN